MGFVVIQLLSILVNDRSINYRSLFVDLLCEAPRMKEFKKAWLNTIGSTSQ